MVVRKGPIPLWQTCNQQFGDIYLPKRWVDLSFNSRVILDFFLVLKLQTSELSKKLDANKFILEIVLNLDPKMLNFKARQKNYPQVETQVNLALGHINVSIDISRPLHPNGVGCYPQGRLRIKRLLYAPKWQKGSLFHLHMQLLPHVRLFFCIQYISLFFLLLEHYL